MTNNLRKPNIQQVGLKQVDEALQVMVNNDNANLPYVGIQPKVWECTWYNVPDPTKAGVGYNAGDSVWMNTEDVDQFVSMRLDKIISYIQNNSLLRNEYESVKNDQSLLFQLCKDIATGAKSGNAMNYPLYFLGDLKDKAQIRVSKCDKNLALPSDDEYWEDFFKSNNKEEFSQQLLLCADAMCKTYLEQHLKEYHLSGVFQHWASQNDDQAMAFEDFYALQDMSNIDKLQEYSPTQGYTDEGIDYIVAYHQKQFANGECVKWFRVWNSGLVEHGGIVDTRHASECGDQLAYEIDNQAQCYKVNLAWKDSTCQAPAFLSPTTTVGFYFEDNKLDFQKKLVDGKSQLLSIQEYSKHVSDDNRYVVSVTPFNDSTTPYQDMVIDVKTGTKRYETNDIVDMKNNSFCIVLSPNVHKYSYYATGFAKNSQHNYK